MTAQLIYKVNLDELIFAQKNKEYGAYQFRQSYNTYLVIAMWISILFVTLLAAGSKIYHMFYPEPISNISKFTKPIIYTIPHDIKITETIPLLEKVQSKISTIKFLPPVVTPDNLATDNYIPTIEELENVEPGLITQEGIETGYDYTLIEDEEKIIEEPEKVTNEFILLPEVLPHPVGGIQAIQSKITYTEIAIKAGIEGRVIVLAYINEAGDVVKTELIKSLGGGLDEIAMNAISETKFEPGKQNGKPVKVQVSIPVLFKLQKKGY